MLEAMGVPADWSAASLRFGLGRDSTLADVEQVAEATITTVEELRARSPLWAAKQSGRPVDW